MNTHPDPLALSLLRIAELAQEAFLEAMRTAGYFAGQPVCTSEEAPE